MEGLVPDYIKFVFLGALGTIQLAAAYSGLDGLLLFRRRPVSAMCGVALLVGSFTWFFASAQRNIPDIAGGLNGNQQAAYFALGAGMALGATLLLSSLLNSRSGQYPNGEQGLDALRRASYIQALAGGIRSWWRRCQQWIQRYSSG